MGRFLARLALSPQRPTGRGRISKTRDSADTCHAWLCPRNRPMLAMMSPMATTERIHPATSLGTVELVVGDLDAMASFYEHAIGLEPVERTARGATLGSAEGGTLIELTGDPDAPVRPRHSTGLFHVAFLVPSRRELARAVRRVVDSGRCFPGAAGHLAAGAP